MRIIKQLDQHLLNLAWSLWTEVGVAGVVRKSQNVLILMEELVLFTSILSEIDPRLRDEALDWCAQYYRFISVSRLKSLAGDFEEVVKKAFSKFAATLNEIAHIDWPVFVPTTPWKVRLSRKSILRPFASPALLNLRARSIFGTGSRADLLTFFLVHPNGNFSIAEVAEIGYSKRNLADVLDDLDFGNLFHRMMQGNQQRYRLRQDSPLFKTLEPIPEYPRPWRLVFKVLLSLRSCIQRVENCAASTQVVEIRTCLASLEQPMQRLGLTPPPFSNDFSSYLESFHRWILAWAALIAEGK